MGSPEWLDVQPLLQRVCEGMAVGELLHGESFSLYDAMTAIEIGDVKMDIGLQRSSDVGTAEELIAAGCAPLDLSGQQLLALLDALLAWEATWHQHAMLPQTVFSSLYMLDVDRLQSSLVLHAYCAGVKSSCSAVVDMVVNGQVCEDEDMLVHAFGMRLLDVAGLPGPKPHQVALQALASAEEWLEQQAVTGASSSSSGGGSSGKASKQPAGKKKQQPTAGKQQQQQQQQSGQGMSSDVASALLARMRFRRLLLEALHALQQASVAGVEQAAKLSELAAAELPRIQGTAALAAGTAPPGFVPEVNRKFMGLAPPRPAIALSLADTVQHFARLLRSLAAACRALLGTTAGWGQLKTTLAAFAAQDLHAIVRSAVHLQLSQPLSQPAAGSGAAGGGSASSSKANGSSSSSSRAPRERGLPPWCPSQLLVCREFGLDPVELPGPDVATFVEQCSIALQGWCHVACLNRCRQRRRHRRLLDDWHHMLDHATNADLSEPFQQWMEQAGWRWPSHEEHEAVGPLSTWVVREVCSTMLSYLQLGFPLDLYQPYEYRALYWYSDYLLGTQQQTCKLLHVTAPKPSPANSPAGTRRAPAAAAAGGRGKKAAAAQHAGASRQQSAEQRHTLELLELEVERMMCQGLFKLATGLIMLGCLPEPPGALSSESARFEQRFGCFAVMSQPEPLSYEQYVQMMRTEGLPPESLLRSAYEHLAKAQRGVAVVQQAAQRSGAALPAAQQAHLAGVSRVAMQNMMALKLMVSTMPKSLAPAAAAPLQGSSGAAAAPAEAAAAAPPPFATGWDFKPALASSGAMFFPVLSLRSSSGSSGGGGRK